MDGVRGGGDQDEVGEGMQCSDHPYRNNPCGICAFCLQEKLGKLVSSSFPNAIFPSSSSSSPSFISEIGGGASSTSLSVRPTSSSSSYSSKDCHYHGNYSRRARIPFLLAQKKKKKEMVGGVGSDGGVGMILKRSKSTTTPRRRHFLVESEDADDYTHSHSPQKRGFWSFLYSRSTTTATRKMDKGVGGGIRNNSNNNVVTLSLTPREKQTQTHPPPSLSHKSKMDSSSSLGKKEEFVEESDSHNIHATASSFGRKVSRSRSVGCGSRSFSGDLFERISTGFGDCTLRRVESQGEGGKHKKSTGGGLGHRNSSSTGPDRQCIMERVKCGGIFGGFIITSSSSSSSSSSYWISSSVEDNGKSTTEATGAIGALPHVRSKSWGWAFASPMRALSKPSSSSKLDHKGAGGKNRSDIAAPNKPNLGAIPSLLAVRG